MDNDMKIPYRRRVIEGCQNIGFLCRVLADAASRRFLAPVDDQEFEAEADGGDFVCDLEHVLMFIERAADAAAGIDPILDAQIREYIGGLLGHGPTRMMRGERPETIQ